MYRPIRLCTHCHSHLPSGTRADARYCSATCRKAAYDQPIWAKAPQPALPPELRQLRDTLIAHASQAAIGYRLGLREGLPETIWFPSANGRLNKRFDGRFDDRPYFELRPCFEPPRVPRATLYEVEFVGADLLVFKPPYALSGGVYVPVATPMCLPGKKHIPRRRPRQSL